MADLDKAARWEPMDRNGIEHLHIRTTTSGLVAQSVVVGTQNGAKYGIFYRIVLDANWAVRELEIKDTAADQKQVLSADGKGKWFDASGTHMTGLDGCIDIDISATPFTNTLPIRRLQLKQGAVQVLRIVYIPVPALKPVAVEQRYTCLQPNKLYRYEGLTSGFMAELTTDEDGFIVDYPGLFRRLL
ncbi:hypothetical protein Asppvi_010698 [Aspergillus pseudoviridinutans]|uniref:Uncharacterized protein n=1 Tax=Aspergillus pseudoviridinutans TaxID=1517512 RepID=A0A9P3BI87_9EURO|nr:uncharacterized protein Asppvi_010698 [Aspergillus pseudoviridinutans]GIJ91726.1 hypothetical protein Asppvi_010698 [Aspergillus pseudoviridinutans]